MERRESLSATEIQEFVSRLRQAIRREYQAQAIRLKRQNLSTELSTNLSTMRKEERSEKENLPPTPPIREKGKKEEMPSAAATRASRVRGESPSWEQVKERAEVSSRCAIPSWAKSAAKSKNATPNAKEVRSDTPNDAGAYRRCRRIRRADAGRQIRRRADI